MYWTWCTLQWSMSDAPREVLTWDFLALGQALLAGAFPVCWRTRRVGQDRPVTAARSPAPSKTKGRSRCDASLIVVDRGACSHTRTAASVCGVFRDAAVAEVMG